MKHIKMKKYQNEEYFDMQILKNYLIKIRQKTEGKQGRKDIMGSKEELIVKLSEMILKLNEK
jgi:hypothetical protein